MKEIEYIDTNVGELLLEEFIKPSALSQNEIARLIAVSNNRINEIVKGKRSVTVDTDLRLCKLFGMRDGFFIRAQEHFNTLIAKREIALELDKIKTIKLQENYI